MVKYFAVAAALKAFSSTRGTERAYRKLGNALGGRHRGTARIPFYYFERVERNVSLCRKYSLLKPGDSVLEIGTGWVHWEALTLRMFFDFGATLYDVWDNRQFDAVPAYVRQRLLFLESKKEFGDAERAKSWAQKILATENFDEFYELCGFEYALDSGGEMRALPDERFALILSGGVLEHVNRSSVAACIASMARVLKPGGHCIHSINITDHLYLYDRSVSPKQYLKYSDTVWRRFFENGVQYINRIQI